MNNYGILLDAAQPGGGGDGAQGAYFLLYLCLCFGCVLDVFLGMFDYLYDTTVQG